MMEAGVPRVFVLNGSNLNMLGIREPGIYGAQTLEDIRVLVMRRAEELKIEVDFRQTNHEGVLIDSIHEAHAGADGIIINAGGFTRTSVSILDALKAVAKPWIELHMANTYRRESYRGTSIMTHGADAIVAGFGGYGYVMALDGILDLIAKKDRGEQIRYS
jgi:3-dehydroquinate dehydratase-2